jgi:hypothetical protein
MRMDPAGTYAQSLGWVEKAEAQMPGQRDGGAYISKDHDNAMRVGLVDECGFERVEESI